MYTDVHSCTPMYTHVHPCTQMYTNVHPVHHVHRCTLMKNPCTLMYTHVHSCIPRTPMYTHIQSCTHAHEHPCECILSNRHAIMSYLLYSKPPSYEMYTMYTSIQHHELGTMVLYHATYGEAGRQADGRQVADEIQVNLETFKNHCILKDSTSCFV